MDVKIPLLREAAVSYGRPFSKNHGELLENHKLSLRHVPLWGKSLHRELMRLRNQQFAHTDIKVYKPRVARFGKPDKPWYPMSFKSYDYSALLAQAETLEKLIIAVEASVHTELSRCESGA